MIKFISKSEKDTLKFAEKYAKNLKNGDIVLLYGEIGAGKTLFVKGAADFFKIKNISSPTFTYMNNYVKFYHFDFYRMENEEYAQRLGITDCFYQNKICFIEWPQMIKNLLPKNAKTVEIKIIDENTREIEY